LKKEFAKVPTSSAAAAPITQPEQFSPAPLNAHEAAIRVDPTQ
jgi:hypothetical protein